ncbi:hypothetical protein ACSMXN_10815 [Jatrophihabitans sp. DSM 45814]
MTTPNPTEQHDAGAVILGVAASDAVFSTRHDRPERNFHTTDKGDLP